MTEATARALARRLRNTQDKHPRAAAGIKAAMVVGGFDPTTTQPDDPQGHIEVALSNARAWDPSYLTLPELVAWIDAFPEPF